MSFSPLPDPRVLEAYERLVPGAAERIIAQWEKQSDHRQDLERYALHADNQRSWGGLIVLAVVSLLALGLAYSAIMAKHDAAGIAAVVVAIATPGGAFAWAVRERRQERLERARLMSGRTDAGQQ